jgi:Tfp pilus assembly protein PilO
VHLQIDKQNQWTLLIRITFLLLAGCLLLYGTLIHPLRDKLNQVQNQIFQSRDKVAGEQSAEVDLAKCRNLVEKEQEHLNSLFPDLQSQPISLLEAIRGLASSNRVSMEWHSPKERSQPSEKSDEELISHHSVTLELKGNYQNLRNCIELLSHLDRIYGIGDYELEVMHQHSEKADSLKAKLTLQIPGMK